MKTYKVIQSSDASSLESQINELAKDGWEIKSSCVSHDVESMQPPIVYFPSFTVFLEKEVGQKAEGLSESSDALAKNPKLNRGESCGGCFYFQIGFHGESMSWCHSRNCPASIDDDVNGCSEYEPLEK